MDLEDQQLLSHLSDLLVQEDPLYQVLQRLQVVQFLLAFQLFLLNLVCQAHQFFLVALFLQEVQKVQVVQECLVFLLAQLDKKWYKEVPVALLLVAAHRKFL